MSTQEKNYFILPVEDDRLVFAITARKTSEETPIILYDGGEHALFYRDKLETIVLDYIDKRAREILKKGLPVAMAEIDPESEKMIRQYSVVVKITEKFPSINLKTKA